MLVDLFLICCVRTTPSRQKAEIGKHTKKRFARYDVVEVGFGTFSGFLDRL